MTTFPLVTAHVDLPACLMSEKDVGPDDDDGDDDDESDTAFAASKESVVNGQLD